MSHMKSQNNKESYLSYATQHVACLPSECFRLLLTNSSNVGIRKGKHNIDKALTYGADYILTPIQLCKRNETKPSYA